MKLDIDPVLNPQAAGAPRFSVAILGKQNGPKDIVPGGVAHLTMGDGKTIRMLYSPEEAIALGQMLITCGCIAAGGMPPVVAEPAASPLILNGNGRG